MNQCNMNYNFYNKKRGSKFYFIGSFIKMGFVVFLIAGTQSHDRVQPAHILLCFGNMYSCAGQAGTVTCGDVLSIRHPFCYQFHTQIYKRLSHWQVSFPIHIPAKKIQGGEGWTRSPVALQLLLVCHSSVLCDNYTVSFPRSDCKFSLLTTYIFLYDNYYKLANYDPLVDNICYSHHLSANND